MLFPNMTRATPRPTSFSPLTLADVETYSTSIDSSSFRLLLSALPTSSPPLGFTVGSTLMTVKAVCEDNVSISQEKEQ
jgi:hypothetical protein